MAAKHPGLFPDTVGVGIWPRRLFCDRERPSRVEPPQMVASDQEDLNEGRRNQNQLANSAAPKDLDDVTISNQSETLEEADLMRNRKETKLTWDQILGTEKLLISCLTW